MIKWYRKFQVCTTEIFKEGDVYGFSESAIMMIAEAAPGTGPLPGMRDFGCFADFQSGPARQSDVTIGDEKNIPIEAKYNMSTYILVNRNKKDKRWWNELVRACAVIGDPFEIHCWYDESAAIMQALQFAHKEPSNWHGGTVIKGRITREFISFLTEAPKPTDTEIYNKMTPFFSIFFGNRLYSEHYGTEMTISRHVRESKAAISKILDEVEHFGTVHRDL